ncbi:hypothetical protein KJA15_01780 [Patescibacteria group bacterium]|nr:hypothetical protein [Patescibacteria group bacterium]
MKLFSQIKLKKIKEFFKKIPEIIKEHIFLSFFVLFFLVLISGGFIFYKYSFLAEKVKPQVTEEPLRFEESLFRDILKEWESREKRFKGTEEKEYSNPFLIPAPVEELVD